jgi:hypothetical protein
VNWRIVECLINNLYALLSVSLGACHIFKVLNLTLQVPSVENFDPYNNYHIRQHMASVGFYPNDIVKEHGRGDYNL